MIRRIELTNFMSHEHTVLEPAAGLTVIVGPNNCGKSAVVAALQILTNNAESTYVMRHGCKECSVAVETDDGHRIEWRRKNSPSYVIDGQQFDRLRKGGLPAELAPALRLKRVADTEDDIHFGEQKSPLFLIDKPAAHAARFFAASSDVSRLVAMQNRHRTKHNEAKKRKIELEAKSARLTQELDALAPLADLDQALQQQEAAFRELGQSAEELKHAIRLEGDLERATQKLHEYSATTTALAPLTAPPELAPTAPLVKWLENWSRESRANDVESARTAALQTLQSPPPLADTQSLAGTTQRLTVAAQTYEEFQQRGVALAPLVPPPSLADTTAAASLLQRLTNAQLNQQREEQALASLAAIAQPPTLADEVPLRAVIEALTAAAKRLTKCEAAWTAVQEIEAAPEFSSPAPLADWLQRFNKQTAEFERHQRDLAALQTESLATAEQLREWARDQETCPTCGAHLDPERLVTELCTGGGAHDA